MKARYNAETNTFRELPEMEKPIRPNPFTDSIDVESLRQYRIALNNYESQMPEYQKHLASLREIPCHKSCKGVFIHDCDYEEGRDYKVYQYEDRLTLAYPTEKDGEDEALIHYEYAGKLAYCLGITINGRDWEEKALPELKKHYTITPR